MIVGGAKGEGVGGCPAHLRVLDADPLYSGTYSCLVSDMRGAAAAEYTVDILGQSKVNK